MKNYYSIEGELYTLTDPQVEKLRKKFKEPILDSNLHEQRLEYIKSIGKYIGPCENLAY